MNQSDVRQILVRAYGDCLLGRVVEAQRSIIELRAALPIEHSQAVAAEVMLIEGVTSLYSGSIDVARNRLKRAILVGDHLPLSDIASVARGWMALAAYNEGMVLDSAQNLGVALSSEIVASPRLRLRISTTASNLAWYANLAEPARVWSLAARRAASDTGIYGVLSSVIFSMAVSSLDYWQQRRISGMTLSDDGADALQAVQSAINYDAGSGSGAQLMLHRLALGMALNICGRHGDAREPLRSYLAEATGSRIEDAACGFVELACAELGYSDLPLDAELLSKVICAEEMLQEPLERAALHAVLTENCERLGDQLGSLAHSSRMKVALAERCAISAELSEVLSRLNLLAPPVGWVG